MPENTCAMYKNRPLVRSNNVICYGYPTDKAVLILTAFMSRTFEGQELSDKILVQIMSTDKSLSPTERLLKQTDRATLSEALEIGSIWLERELSK